MSRVLMLVAVNMTLDVDLDDEEINNNFSLLYAEKRE